MAQDDYAIANAAGATVRADINSQLAAIVSNNAGAAAPSTTFAHMYWADTTNDILKRRNAANSAWMELLHFDETNGLFRIDFDKGADIASATTTDIGAAAGNSVTITGTTTITGLGTIKAGVSRLVTFAGALTLTHNETSLILPGGANITTAAGDMMWAESLGSGNWRVFYQRADGRAVVGTGVTLETEQATTSGTTKDFIDIPAGTMVIHIMLDAVSLSGSDELELLLGDSTSFETTGYSGAVLRTTAGPSSLFSTSFLLNESSVATDLYTGRITLTLMNATNTWVLGGMLNETASSAVHNLSNGRKSLTGPLTRLRLKPTGSDTFDGGAWNISYHG